MLHARPPKLRGEALDLPPEFWIFALVGALAQLIDGALGMGYGVVSSTVLLSLGVPPANASASVHAAKMFTGAASAASHALYKNVDLKLLLTLSAGGIVGGCLGAYVLTSIDGHKIKPFVVAWLAIMGVLILWRAWKQTRPRVLPNTRPLGLGLVGGFFDAVGGGGWGPVVTSTLLGSGADPRKAIGTTNTAEFFVTSTISAAFLAALLSGHWEHADGIATHATSVLGLVLGGLVAAPFAGFLVKIAPARVLTYAVGTLVLGLAGYQTLKLAGVL